MSNAGSSLAVDLVGGIAPDPQQLASGFSAFVDAGEDSAVAFFPDSNTDTLERKLAEFGDPARRSDAGVPRNNPLIAPIERFRETSLEDLAGNWPLRRLAEEATGPIWIEVWAVGGTLAPKRLRATIEQEVMSFAGLTPGALPPRKYEAVAHDIYLLRVAPSAISLIPRRLPAATVLRPPSQARLERFARERIGDVIADDLIEDPDSRARTIAVLDSGVHGDHPLLEKVLVSPGVSVVPGVTSPRDAYPGGHGTGMAGAAAYSALGEQISGGGPVKASNRLANVRLWSNDAAEDLWGSRTEEAVLAAEAMSDDVAVHLLCLSTGARPRQARTSWSYAVDKLGYNDGAGRVILIAAGNVNASPDPAAYPATNASAELHDPAQAVNAIAVGGYTTLDAVSADRAGMTPVARSGEISPHSTTGTPLGPIKPDVVFEAGNACPDGTLANSGLEELSVLTTAVRHAEGRPLESDHGTSIATAALACGVGEIASVDPAWRPETVRALTLNSTWWTPEMRHQFPARAERLRCVGYGVPRPHQALHSTARRATLVHEGTIAPYSNPEGKLDALHLFRLPLPAAELLALGEATVRLSATLSFFVEPHETRVTRYAGASLQWDLQRRAESEEDFLARINQMDRDPGNPPADANAWPWEVGTQARSRGSVQTDRMEIEAAALSKDLLIGVFPAGGWWGDNLRVRKGREMPYALVVTIDVGEANVDLYALLEARLLIDVPLDAS